MIIIAELQSDLIEFDEQEYGAIFKNMNGAKIIIDYLFKEDVNLHYLEKDEFIEVMNGHELLEYLIKENEVL